MTIPDERRLSPTLFYALSIARFAILPPIRRLMRGTYNRTSEAVIEEYDPPRSEFLEEFRQSDWSLDEFIMREASEGLGSKYFFANVVDGEITRGRGREVRSRLLERLASAIEEYAPQTIVEVGAGTGRNLLFLKRRMPHISAIGFDISQPSIETAREAAKRYSLDVNFEVCDVSGPWPLESVDLVFSVHAIEQIPNSDTVLRSMMTHANDGVVLFEPLPDLWRGLPGAAGRLRASYLDRFKKGAVDAFDVRHKELLPDGMALNRTSEIHLSPDGLGPGC